MFVFWFLGRKCLFFVCLTRKQSTPTSPKNKHFLPIVSFLLYRFFGKLDVLCFLVSTRFEIRSFASLPTISSCGIKKSSGILTGKILVHSYLFNWWNSDLTFCPSSSTLFVLLTDGFNFWNCFFSFYVHIVSYSRTFIHSWH